MRIIAYSATPTDNQVSLACSDGRTLVTNDCYHLITYLLEPCDFAVVYGLDEFVNTIAPLFPKEAQGHRGVGSLTYQWQMSAADSDAGYSNIGGATTASYNATGAPSDGSGRYFRTVLNATGASQATSVADRGYRIAAPATPTPPSTPSSATTLASTLFPLAMIIFPIVYFVQMSSKSQGVSPVVAVGLMAVIAIGAMALLAALMAAF